MRLMGSWFRELAPEELRAQVPLTTSLFIAMLLYHHLSLHHWILSALMCDSSLKDLTSTLISLLSLSLLK